MRDSVLNYLWLGIAAFFGVLARAARWTKTDGTFDAMKAFLECLTAPAIGIMAGGVCQYFSPAADPMIVGAIAATMGLLGPAALSEVAMKFLIKKAEG